MTEQVQQKSTQQIIVIFLVVIAVLLAALVVVIVTTKSNKPAASTAATSTAPDATTQQPPAGMGQGAAAEVPFDAKTATVVPSGQTPESFVKAYHEAVQKKDYEAAYKMLPIAKQQSYGDAKSYGEQVGAYGITSYKLGKAVTSGDTVTIAAEQVTPQMPITYTWTFKKVSGKWYCSGRDMGGTVQ